MERMPDIYAAGPASDARVLALADQCVLCGLCLQHCPTYRLDATEAESPRGRIALARALAAGTLEPAPGLIAHLDHCLGCLSCEKVCPSKVQYDELLVRTRARLREAPARAARSTPAWLRDPIRLTRLARVGAALRAGRWLPALARLLPNGWRRLAQTQPRLPAPIRFAPAAPRAESRGTRIGLFRGCVASVYDLDTLAAARRLLEALGHEVVEVAGTTCCGALPRHHGDIDRAAALALASRTAFEAANVNTLVVAASGCHGDLRDQAFAGSAVAVVDIHAFVAADAQVARLRFRALPQRAALHLPCSQVNTVGAIADIRALLARIPKLAVLALPEQPRCCGAAGSYFIEFPAKADALRDEKLAQATALAPDLMITTNIGCRIHFDNGLRDRASPLRIVHPLVLLAEQLENPSP